VWVETAAMTQLTLPFAPTPRGAADGQLDRLTDRVRRAGRRLDLIDFGVTLWLTLWASCVTASVFLLTGH